MDIRAWLQSLGLEQFAPVFEEQEIDEEVLVELTAEDLKELGFAKLGQRKKLLAAIAALSRDGPAQQAPGDAEAPTPLEGEQRQVTVLFADLSGFTQLSSELGAEETHALLNRYFAAVDGTIERYGGSIDKHIGDNVMALFGAPLAHSNDPERAIRAALDIHQEMNGLSRELGRELRAHIGIASGQVVASGTGSDAHQEYTVTGDSVNLASRLQDKAGPGETLISEAVQRAVGSLAECESLGALEVKGLRDGVKTWRVLTLSEDGPEIQQTRFVGRRTELTQFASAIDACRQAGAGQVVFVRGDAGIGKSRLLSEFGRLARKRGLAIHRGLVLDFGVGEGKDAVRSLVRSLIGLPAGADKFARAASVSRVIDEALLARDQEVFLNDLLDLSQPTGLRAIYDAMDNVTRNRGKQAAVADLVRATSRSQPLLLSVEDIQSADPLTLAHLSEIAAAVADCPAILVMTSRREGDPIDATWRAQSRGSPLTTMDLGPLREADAVELASGFLGATSSLVQDCIARAEGNPLFLEQLLRNAGESGQDHLPASIQSLILARMDRLPAEDKRALQAAAVIGQHFGVAAVRHLIGNERYDCARLVGQQLVRPEGDGFLFAHALIREGAYSSLLKSKAHALHRRAAAHFADHDPVLRAQHLDRAEDGEAPAAYLEAAAEQASAFRYERALKLVERGLALASEQDVRFSLTMALGDVQVELGDPTAAKASYQGALAFTALESDACRARIGIASCVRLLGGYDEGIAALEKAEAHARGAAMSRELAQIHYYRGSLLFAQGDIEGCLREHRHGLEQAERAEDPEWQARTLSGLGDALYARGSMASALGYFDRCIDLCQSHGLGRIEVANRYMVGNMRRYMNEFEAALDEVAAAVELAKSVGNLRAEMVASMLRGEFLLDRGEPAAAEGPLANSLSLAEAMGNRRFQTYVNCQQARGLLITGRRAEAETLLQDSLEIARQTGLSFVGPRLYGLAALATRDTARRAGALADGAETIGQGCNAHNVLWFYRDAIDACLEGGDWNGAEGYADTLARFTAHEPLAWAEFFIARGRALAAFGKGDRSDATRAELCRVRDEADRVGIRVALPAIAAALTAAA